MVYSVQATSSPDFNDLFSDIPPLPDAVKSCIHGRLTGAECAVCRRVCPPPVKAPATATSVVTATSVASDGRRRGRHECGGRGAL